MKRRNVASTKQHVFLVPYREVFEWSLCLEYSLELNSRSEDVTILDFSYFEKNLFSRTIKFLLGYRKIQPRVLSIIKEQGVKQKTLQAFRPRVKVNIYRNVIGELDFTDKLNWYCYPSLADKLRSERIIVKDNIGLIRSELSTVAQTLDFVRRLEKLYPSKETVFYTTNGRYSRNLTLVNEFRQRGYEVKVLETHRRGGYQVWQNAQSISELETKINFEWENSDHDLRSGIAEQYLANRTQIGKGDNSIWKSKMSDTDSLELDPKYRYCVFFTTSQIEYVYGHENIRKGDFLTQQEAVHALAKSFRGTKWRLIVRRHPNPSGWEKQDSETESWEFLEDFPEVAIVLPNSSVNSYLLARSANLVAHFHSSIGAEIIAMDHVPVISMGPTPWSQRDMCGKIQTRKQLDQYLAGPMQKVPPSVVYPWAYFYANGGKSFSHISVNGYGVYTLNGLEIHKSFSEWEATRWKSVRRLIQAMRSFKSVFLN